MRQSTVVADSLKRIAGNGVRVQAIARAAQELVQTRAGWLNPPSASEERKRRTLTNLYNQRPTWLDLAVLDAYGWPHKPKDDILGRLLWLNLDRSFPSEADLLAGGQG